MHLEKSFQQFTLVDDHGTRHNLCDLLAEVCPKVNAKPAKSKPKPKPKGNADGSKTDVSDQGAKESKSETGKTGADTGEKANPKGATSGGKNPSGGNQKTGTKGKA